MDIPSIKSITDIMSAVLAHDLSREKAADWASKAIAELENRRATYNSANDEKKVWDALVFLQGIDLQDSPNTYLHNEEDLISHQKLLETPTL